MIVTFFGHKDAPTERIKEKLYHCLTELIERDGAEQFYIGNQGAFDMVVIRVLRDLKSQYPNIKYEIVLPYLPKVETKNMDERDPTIYPAGMATVPKRFAVDRRNHWMIDQSDIIVTFVERPFGGAAKFKEIAQRKKKLIIELSE